eukprot:10432274-Alexandrium_andersonii.AAC.1
MRSVHVDAGGCVIHEAPRMHRVLHVPEEDRHLGRERADRHADDLALGVVGAGRRVHSRAPGWRGRPTAPLEVVQQGLLCAIILRDVELPEALALRL